MNSSNKVNTRHLPSWVPEALITSCQQWVLNQSQWLLELSSLDEIKKIPQVAPSNSITSLLLFLGYEPNKSWIYEDFVWKSILDIWGWFWWIAPNLFSSAWNITVVDPIFNEKDLGKLLEKTLESQANIKWLREEYLTKNKWKLSIRSDICEAGIVYKECSWWKDYTREKFPNVKRNNSYWEKLVWIDDNSLDFVFLTYVLSKQTVKMQEVINEVNRVLKINWTLIISDYEDNKWFIPYLSKFFRVEIKLINNDWIIIECNKK